MPSIESAETLSETKAAPTPQQRSTVLSFSCAQTRFCDILAPLALSNR